MPYAVEIDGQIMVVYDPVHHDVESRRPTGPSRADDRGHLAPEPEPYDRRYAHVRRPVVLTGGELTLEQLDLQYDPYTKMYQAPFQVKANGGVLILDDFGRQRVPPARPAQPLDRAAREARSTTSPCTPAASSRCRSTACCIFATNLEPVELVEEAFLRRIHYKIMVEDPTAEQFAHIFQRNCAERGIAYDPRRIVRYIYEDWYGGTAITPRACHPRDILDHVVDIAKFQSAAAARSRWWTAPAAPTS